MGRTTPTDTTFFPWLDGSSHSPSPSNHFASTQHVYASPHSPIPPPPLLHAPVGNIRHPLTMRRATPTDAAPFPWIGGTPHSPSPSYHSTSTQSLTPPPPPPPLLYAPISDIRHPLTIERVTPTDDALYSVFDALPQMPQCGDDFPYPFTFSFPQPPLFPPHPYQARAISSGPSSVEYPENTAVGFPNTLTREGASNFDNNSFEQAHGAYGVPFPSTHSVSPFAGCGVGVNQRVLTRGQPPYAYDNALATGQSVYRSLDVAGRQWIGQNRSVRSPVGVSSASTSRQATPDSESYNSISSAPSPDAARPLAYSPQDFLNIVKPLPVREQPRFPDIGVDPRVFSMNSLMGASEPRPIGSFVPPAPEVVHDLRVEPQVASSSKTAGTSADTRGQKRKATFTLPSVGRHQAVSIPISDDILAVCASGVSPALHSDDFACTYISPVTRMRCPKKYKDFRSWKRHYTTRHVEDEYDALKVASIHNKDAVALKYPGAAVQTVKCCFPECTWKSKVGVRLDMAFRRHMKSEHEESCEDSKQGDQRPAKRACHAEPEA